ncbi:hypothetical protein F2Q69_00047780 [Brassica cretica]|uniref:Uncharacterized protein n=1 Tax=Brassica cretica TaxID=69181 RepID=A0A8S9PVR9_BRACR|nr:hypothetical protein F2Q69_00047780 [Brassica cretica]
MMFFEESVPASNGALETDALDVACQGDTTSYHNTGQQWLMEHGISRSSKQSSTLQENSGILTDIPTENKILGISRRISEDILRKHKIWFPHNFIGIYRRNSEKISIRRNILMEYRREMYSSEKTDEFRGYIIAVGRF